MISRFLLICRTCLTGVLFVNLEGAGEKHILRGKMISFEIIEFEVMIQYIFLSIR